MSTADQASRPADVAPGDVVGGKWRVGPLIGRGGMGAVYEGTNTSIGKKVALKFIDAEFAKNPEIAGRFQREAEAASLVESAHIVHVFDSGISDTGLPYIVMELLRGEDLRGRLARLERLPIDETAHIAAQTLRGLHRAHEAGIVHRDLKPDNIFLVDRDDDPLFAKIVDFGISKVNRRPGDTSQPHTQTRQGVVLGTPFYMSPEQAQAFPDVDHRTDLWSIGAILFECLAGRPPHTGESYETIIISICTTQTPDVRAFDPSVPASLAEVVARALTRDRAQRFQTAKEMLEALLATGIAKGRAVGGPATRGSGAQATAESSGSSGAAHGAPSGRTRVSWTSAGSKAASPVEGDVSLGEEISARASSVRRRGLLVVGALVMAATFVLTAALLRARQNHAEENEAPFAGGPAPSGVAAAATAPSASSDKAGRAPITNGLERDTTMNTGDAGVEGRSPKETSLRGPTLPNSALGKGRKSQPSPPAPPAPPPPVAVPSPPASPPAGSARSGVAGGLQIKTTYP